MLRAKRIALLFVILITCVGCDQATKSVAQNQLAAIPPISYLNGLVRLEYIENDGAFLSLGANLSANTQFWIFTVFVSAILFGLLLFTLRISHKITLPLLVALALYLGGGMGNLLDRLTNNGHVVDFMSLGIGPLRTGVFNVADMAIMAGAVIFILYSTIFSDILNSTSHDARNSQP